MQTLLKITGLVACTFCPNRVIVLLSWKVKKAEGSIIFNSVLCEGARENCNISASRKDWSIL